MKGKTKRIFDILVTYCLLVIVAGIFLFPCLWLVLASFSATGNLYSIPGFFPSSYSFNAFITLFTDTQMYDYPKWLLNTFIIATCSCILSTLLVILTAYVISRFEFKARKPLMKGALVLGMFPSFMSVTIIYVLMTQFKLINNIFGLVLIYSCTAPMGYLVQKGFFDTIPSSIYEAARIDGANNVRIFRDDSNLLAPALHADVVYIDPPYNSRQYNSAYHVYENLVRWEKPVVRGVACKFDQPGSRSRYCTVKAAETFADLVSNLNTRYIVLSYNNMAHKGNERSNAKISDGEIMQVLGSKGDVRVFSRAHKPFSSGRSDIKDNKERLFVCTCHNR